MAIINDEVINNLETALSDGDSETYNQIKEEHWILDFEDYEETKNWAFKDLMYKEW